MADEVAVAECRHLGHATEEQGEQQRWKLDVEHVAVKQHGLKRLAATRL